MIITTQTSQTLTCVISQQLFTGRAMFSNRAYMNYRLRDVNFLDVSIFYDLYICNAYVIFRFVNQFYLLWYGFSHGLNESDRRVSCTWTSWDA